MKARSARDCEPAAQRAAAADAKNRSTGEMQRPKNYIITVAITGRC
jgi:hypothetical protein